MQTLNAYCFECNEDLKVEGDLNASIPCPKCGEIVKILGISLDLTTSNGEYKKHL